MLADVPLLLLLKSLQLILRIMPEKAQRATGVLLGRATCFLLGERRGIAVENIGRVFPEKSEAERLRIAKRCFENLGVNFVESLLMPFLPKEHYGLRFTVENRHFADEALSRGKGLIALAFHFGNWELMGAISWFVQQEIIVLARPLKGHRLLNRFLAELRESTGLKVIPNANTAKDVMRYLKEGRIVAILGDQREKRSQAVWVDLFGVKVPTSRGTAMIAMKTGAPVLPVHVVREGFLRYRFVLAPPLEMGRHGDIRVQIEENTRKINSTLEALILAYPEEWFWVHRRWGRKNRRRA